MSKSSTTAANKGSRRGEAAGATSTVVEQTDAPNPMVDAQLEAIGMEPSQPVDESSRVPLTSETSAPAPSVEQPTPDPKEGASPPPAQPPVPLATGVQPPADNDLLNPFTRGPLPPPKETKRKQQQERADNREAINKTTPSTRRFGAMGNKLPGAEHIIVRKRTDTGQLAYIGEFNSADLAQSQNIESYLARYIQPKYGAGEYWISGVDAAGREFDAGYVQLLKAADDALMGTPGGATHASGTSPLSLIQQMLDREARRRDAELQALSSKREKDPIDLMRQMHELQKEMSPPPPMPPLKPTEKGSSTTDTVLAGMMQMMTTVLAQALQPSPLMVALIQKLTNKVDTPLQSAPDPTQQLLVLSEVVKNLGGNRGDSVSSQMIELLMKERMAPSDVLSLVQQVKGERGTDDLKKSMENLGFLLNAVQQLRAHTEPGGSGFWDAVNSIFSNPGLANAIGSKVNAVVQQPGNLPPGQQRRPAVLPPGAPTQEQQPPARDPLALKARELIARKQRIEELELHERERRLGIVPSSGAPQQPADAPAAPQAPAAAQVEQPAPAEQVNIPATADQQITLPAHITDHLNSYIAATSDADYVRTTIELIFSLAEDEQWRPYSEVIVSFILQNDRAKFMHYMSSLLTALRTTNLLEDQLAQKIMNALQAHFDTIVSETQGRIEVMQQGASGAEDTGFEDVENPEEEEYNEEGEDEDLLHLNDPQQ
jgi:hypothetical protein